MKTPHRFLAVAFALAASSAFAQVNQSGTAPDCTNACSSSNQQVGDVTSGATATNSTSTSSQSGNSANNNGASIAPVITNNPQTEQSQGNTSQNATANQSNTGGNTNGTITGGNTNSAANGNQSTNANNSSVGNTSASTGASTSNSGGNNLSTGASNSGGNRLVNGSNTATNTATGGAGGSGGAGGAGGRASSSSVSSGGTQGQQQASTSNGGSSNGGSNRNAVNTGGASNGQVVGGSGNGTTAVNTGGNTNSYSAIYAPPYPETPPAMVGVGQVTLSRTACGPLEQAIPTDVIGTYFGFFLKSHIKQGQTWRTQAVYDENTHERLWYNYVKLPDGTTQIMGSQITRAYSNESISGGRSIGGMGGSGTNIGQLGGGSSAAMSQLVVDVQIDDCPLGKLEPKPEPAAWVPAPTQTYVPYPNQTPVRHYHRRKPKALCAPVKK
jgi:hypothetical protein